jgi:hypothetical protein
MKLPRKTFPVFALVMAMAQFGPNYPEYGWEFAFDLAIRLGVASVLVSKAIDDIVDMCRNEKKGA